MLGGVIAAVVVAAGAGWLVGSRIRSPGEIAAAAQPPPASNITVAVVRQTLSADVITRGDIVFDDPVSVSLSGSFAEQPEKLVVTQAVEVDTELGEGDLAVEVVGRPVFLLQGEIPMFRDLRPGSSGDDVFQVNEALVRMGYLEGTPGDTWTEATGEAVAAWYRDRGYLPNGPSQQDEETLRAARERVRGAEAAVADGEAALREAQQGSGQAGITAARNAVADAEDALRLAKFDQGVANQQAADAVAEAQKKWEEAEPDDKEEAKRALDQARTDQQRTELEQKTLVDSAVRRVDEAKAALADAQRGIDTAPFRRQIESARDELSAAREELAELERTLGVWLPAGEVVFLRRLPVRVDQVAVSRGSEIEGSFITVSGSDLALRSFVPEREAPRVQEGMPVRVENPMTGEDMEGVISFKSDRAGTHGVSSDRVYLEITLDELPNEIIGANVRVTIPVSSTGGEVLAVPAAALSATADGSTIVQVDDGNGNVRNVRVETGLAAGGLVEVTPLGGDLAEGDLVVVGLDRGQAQPEGPLDEPESPPEEPETEA